MGDGWGTIEHMFDASDDSSVEERGARAHALLDAVLAADPATDPGSVLSAALEARAQLVNLLDGAATAVLPAWEASCDWAQDGSSTPVTWLVNHTGVRRAAAAAERRTASLIPSMPHVAAASGAGQLTASHIAQLARARTPEVAEAFDRDEALLVGIARTLAADALSRALLAWRYRALEEAGRNDPEGSPGTETDDSTLSIVRSFQGRGLLRADLTAADVVALTEAIDARIETWRRAGQLADDTRTYQELYAAALLDLVADGSTSSRRRQARPLLIAIATLSALFDRADVDGPERDAWQARILGGGPLSRAALQELMERANISLVITTDDGQPLHVGRAQRLATAAMLAALVARSGGTCEFPGCHASHHRCHAHHIVWWRNGGETGVVNLALLCPHHHRLVHRGWTLTRGPTGLVFRRPDGTQLHGPPFADAA